MNVDASISNAHFLAEDDDVSIMMMMKENGAVSAVDSVLMPSARC